DGALLTLDVCSPTGDPDARALRPAVVSVHGGSWARGDKGNADWRAVCTWLASEGFVAYSVNYRLVPDALFPAAIDDVSLAVEWIRQTDNAGHYGIDPDRIGAFGGSAGGNLVALLGARGSGSLTTGARVAAVAELSGPTDLGHEALVVGNAPAGLQRIVQSYLGCDSLADCPAARAASPLYDLDRSDPPVFIGTAAEEFIPLTQSTKYADRLDRFGIANELVTVPGTLHSIGILDATMRVKVAAFLHRTLGD
ncbi:MAG TPA: alpha/beta hydrolase, partial [Solirubrobacterales bacterium]|nr:alpha/beta hydrolase [Solirubrobacterales bacterium]